MQRQDLSKYFGVGSSFSLYRPVSHGQPVFVLDVRIGFSRNCVMPFSKFNFTTLNRKDPDRRIPVRRDPVRPIHRKAHRVRKDQRDLKIEKQTLPVIHHSNTKNDALYKPPSPSPPRPSPPSPSPNPPEYQDKIPFQI
jgi:hypothetical protein